MDIPHILVQTKNAKFIESKFAIVPLYHDVFLDCRPERRLDDLQGGYARAGQKARPPWKGLQRHIEVPRGPKWSLKCPIKIPS